MSENLDNQSTEELSQEDGPRFRYLFAYNAIIMENRFGQQPVTKLVPGAMELELSHSIETTYPVNELVKSLMDKEHKRLRLGNPNLPDIKVMQVSITNFILLCVTNPKISKTIVLEFTPEELDTVISALEEYSNDIEEDMFKNLINKVTTLQWN